MKQGIQTQFTWIFILIAGAIILTFFITISYRQKALAEEKISIELERHLDDIISSSLQSPGTAFPIPAPPGGVSFRCASTCDCRISVGRSPKGSDFAEKIIFAHDYLEGEDLILWTQLWAQPFRATNFIYVTNSRVKYYMVTDSSTRSLSLKDAMLEVIPHNLSIEFIDIDIVASTRYVNEQNVKFFFLESGKTPLHESFRGQKVFALELRGNELTFLFKDEDSLSFSTQGDPLPILTDDLPTVFAGLFSANRAMFLCGIQHAYKKLGFVSRVLEQRTRQLDGFENRCFTAGPAALQPLQSLVMLASELAKTPADSTKVAQLTSLKESLERLNKEKLRDGCPALY